MQKSKQSTVDTMSCVMCAEKHITKARALYNEYRQNPEFELELALCVGNIGCTEDHLLTEFYELATACRELRLSIQENRLKDISLFDEIVLKICKTAGLFK